MTQLTEEAEILFRQVHPQFVQNGEPSSQNFMPTHKDNGKLSIDRSSIVGAAEAYSLFVRNGFLSSATYGISVEEFGAEGIACFEDPLDAEDDRIANPAHAIADYSQHKPSQQKTKAKRLKLKAIARGRLHP